MLSGNELWSLVSLVVAIFALGLGIFVLRANHSERAARVFFFVMFVMFLGGCTDFLFMNAPDEEMAVALARLLLFLLVLEMGSLLYLATFLPFESSSGWFRGKVGLLFLVVWVAGMIPALLLQPEDVVRTSYGWGVQGVVPLGTCGAIIIALAIAADIMLAQMSRRTNDRNARVQILIVAVATSVPIVYSFVYAALEGADLNLPPILSPGYLISALIMAYAVLRYRLFTIKVDAIGGSIPTGLAQRHRFEPGTSILFLEKKGAMAYSALENEIDAGSLGVVFSHLHPDLVRQEHGLQGVPIIWLAKQPGEGRINPASLGILQMSVSDFLRHHEGAAVLMEGIESLLANNSLEVVLKLLYHLNDEVVVSKGRLMMTMDPDIMPIKGLAMLVRDFQVVEGKGAGTEI